jgi:spermidine synthase
MTQTRFTLYTVFILSGFSGLVYESIWSHYLKLFLGHAAYAQALVLVMFMGGMALGAWLVSRFVHRIKNLLMAYAALELLIGLLGLLFDPMFGYVQAIAYTHIIPALGNPTLVNVVKFLISALLLLPPSLLLGATFPLMSSGFIRTFPDAPGKSLALLYFSNSIGAALALPVSAFFLIDHLGLPGTLNLAAAVNLLVAFIVWSLTRDLTTDSKPAASSTGRLSGSQLFLVLSFFTGMASFIYEVTWIRMLSMVLGASTYSFELMLSAFITGLAIGGYLVRKRIDQLGDPALFAAGVQIAMGLCALMTIFMYGYSFEAMSLLMTALDETGPGYVLFSAFSHMITLLIMLPATICAGMTLPLFTYALIRRGHAENCIGQIYAANTLGAICGVLFTVFIGLPLLGVKGSIVIGAAIDICLGMVLLGLYRTVPRIRPILYVTTVVALVYISAASLFQFNTKMMASGVFRHGVAELDDKTDILYHRDGKTASVTVTGWDKTKVTIMTNGKPDAAITMAAGAPPSIDEATMTLLAALPLSVHPQARTIANIGMGSGLTAHTALLMPGVERVDTIEIEEAIIEGAGLFRPATERVFSDPRSFIHLDDARTWLSSRRSGYDIIISEPSNPWVSGVASLFTTEFYRLARTRLNSDGVLVQWIHIYELNTQLLVSILKAIADNFPYYSVYFADDGNLILIASVDTPIAMPDQTIFESEAMKQQLDRVYVRHLEDLRYRFLGDQSLYNPFLARFDIRANSDYYPVLDLGAEKARYLRENVTDLLNLRLSTVPILDILYGETAIRTANPSRTDYFPDQQALDAYKLYEYFSQKVFDQTIISPIASLNFLQSAASNCNQEYNLTVWVDSFYIILSKTVGTLTGSQLDEIIRAITPQCAARPGTELQQHWLTLFNSFNSRNYTQMTAALVELLDSQSGLNMEQQKFLYTWLLTTLIKTGEHAKAALLWNDYMKNLFEVNGKVPLELQMLLAILNTK